jgi:exopolyphosphatase/pppGpp-phosphohydrolase
MKWVTENLDAEAMIVSRRKLRRGLFAEDVNLREAISQRAAQFEAMHDC